MLPIQFLYLSTANLNDRVFLNDLFKNYPKLPQPSIILHEGYRTSLDDVRFLTKRLSVQLSEVMVPNLAVSGDQRNLLTFEDDKLIVKTAIIDQLFQSVHCLVINALAQRNRKTELASITDVLKAFRQQVNIDSMIFFPMNSMSPLGGLKRAKLSIQDEYDEVIKSFEEEKQIINLAWNVKPSVIASANSYYIE